MEFIKIITEIEQETIDHYRKLASGCIDNEGLRNILNRLAGDHARHIAALAGIMENKTLSLKKTGVFQEVKKIFSEMQEERKAFQCDIGQAEMYRKALDLINRKLKFYRDNVNRLDNDDFQGIIKQIISEEEQQKFFLENIIEMVMKPETWIEDAEFTHLDEY
ncbi:MAG: hypothetical protein JW784_00170 [Candidatus Cloacimonetes bacterium]|nr:hypothetical protein [Candidatus Cloacimonadota bacterium]